MVDHSELINITSNPQQHLIEQRTEQRIGFLSRLNYKIQLEVRMQGIIPHASGLMSLVQRVKIFREQGKALRQRT
jgi:hypothetical protein